MTTHTTPHPDQPEGTAPCDGCGQPVPRRWLIGAHHCDRCSDVIRRVEAVVDWRWDQELNRHPVDPLQALTDLSTARAAANRLLRRTVTEAVAAGATWDEIGRRLGLDPRDAAARYR